MPWTTKDVDSHNKGLSSKEKEQWVAVANSALQKCLDDGGDRAECERSAIMQANGVVKEARGEGQGMGGEPQGDGGVAMCVCPECGHKAKHERGTPCTEIECPECGTMMEPAQEESMTNVLSVSDTSQDVVVLWDESYWQLSDGEWTWTEGAYESEPEPPTVRELLEKALALLDDEPEEEIGEMAFSESAVGHVLTMAEQASDGPTPLHLDVAIIQPGWGNKRDNHYYPREILERDAGVFEGVKMYESDHRPEEKSTRTWVSTITGISGFTDDGAPIGRVSVHDEGFAKRLQALAADNLLSKMECSILAGGRAKKGKVDGRKANIVEAITSADSVDWVTRAGAGGRALALAESENGGEPMDEQEQAIEEQDEELEEVTLQEQQEPEEPPDPVMLDQERVAELVGESNLPDASKARLSEAEYADEDAVGEAIKTEIAYVKEVMGSGKPFAQGASDPPPEHKPRTAEEADADWNRILTEVGMPHLGG